MADKDFFPKITPDQGDKGHNIEKGQRGQLSYLPNFEHTPPPPPTPPPPTVDKSGSESAAEENE